MNSNDHIDPDTIPPESTPQIRDKLGRILPGATLNPGGRTQFPKSFRIASRQFMDGTGWEKLFAMAKNARSAYKPDIQLRALELIAAYAYGRPPQRHEVMTEDDGSKGVISRLTAIMAVQLSSQTDDPALTDEGSVLEAFPGLTTSGKDGTDVENYDGSTPPPS